MISANGRVSATSLSAYEQCPQMWAAKYIDYVPEPQTTTKGSVGSTVHHALQHFVDEVCLQKITEWSDIDRLRELLQEGYIKEFDTFDTDTDDYADAKKLTEDWYDRTDLSDVRVLSVEEKLTMPVGNTGVDCTYIFDRIDLETNDDGETELRITDYKSTVQYWNPETVADKLQFKIYALAAMIQFKELKPAGIWVTADMLRYNSRPGVYFTRAEIEHFWKEYLLKTVKKILATEREDAPYKLGSGCRFCPIKLSCPALMANVDAGGLMQITEPHDAALMLSQVTGKLEGLSGIISYLEKILITESDIKNEDTLEYPDEDGSIYAANLTKKKSRYVTDPARVATIIGPELTAKIGKINIGDIDKLVKSGSISAKQKAQIDELIGMKTSKASIKITQKGL